MREITTHKVGGLNEALGVFAMDEPGEGGANHQYAICGVPGGDPNRHHIFFQKGPIAEAGVNGVSNEALLAIVADRLECFQKGPYACRDNAVALTKIHEAMMWLQRRTLERVARGVEGTSAV